MPRPNDIRTWELIALIAAIVIVLSFPVYYFAVEKNKGLKSHDDTAEHATFVGSSKCKDCHKAEYDKWQDSHHDHAMEVASDNSVLGDFNDTEFTVHGITSRFYRKDDGFYVHTNGPGGEMGGFEITHTFGWFPLQQYLIPFPGGRLQTLPIAWDSRENKWFRVPPVEPVAPDDWLYWTNAAQNWNGMCAQCHSTNLVKGYDAESRTFSTTWSEIDVSCEACHGPGSAHVAWADLPLVSPRHPKPGPGARLRYKIRLLRFPARHRQFFLELLYGAHRYPNKFDRACREVWWGKALDNWKEKLGGNDQALDQLISSGTLQTLLGTDFEQFRAFVKR